MKIVLFFRRSFNTGNFSIEKVFNTVYSKIYQNDNVKKFVSKYHTTGFLNRFYNALEARYNQGDVNHITGDIHYISLFLNGSKTILTIHDFVILRRSSGIRYVVYYLFWYYLPILKCKYITVISEQIKIELLLLFPFAKNKVFVIHNPLTIQSRNVNKIFNRVKPIILHIGVSENKNLLNTIYSLTNINCHLRIIGKINSDTVLLLNNLGIDYSFAFNLSDDEIVSEYCNADILSYLSTYEGFGLPIIEAQSLGIPVLLSNIPVFREISGLDSKYLVNPKDCDEISNSFIRIINDDHYRHDIIKLGIKNVDRFSADLIAKKYQDLYKKIN